MLTEMAVFVMAFLIFVSKRVGGFTYTAYVPVNIAATHEITVATCAGFSLALSFFLHFACRVGGDSGGSFEPSLQLSTLQLSAILVL